MADRFFSELPVGLGETVLEGAEAHHLTHVLRIGVGETATLFNGDGKSYEAVVRETGKKSVRLEVIGISTPAMELGHRLTIASAMPKGDRADYLIEKLTELGVTDFVPLRTARSIVHPREAKADKLRRAVIEASKQCGRNVLMSIHEMTTALAFFVRVGLPANRFIAHPRSPKATTKSLCGSKDVVFAIGPEGGFTEDELASADAAGWEPMNLGPRILRIETAAVAVAALATMPGRDQ